MGSNHDDGMMGDEDQESCRANEHSETLNESTMELLMEGKTADKLCSVSEDGRPPLKRFKGVQLKERPRCNTCLIVLQLMWNGCVPKFCPNCATLLNFHKTRFELSNCERWIDPEVESDSDGGSCDEDYSPCNGIVTHNRKRHFLNGIDDSGRAITIEHKPDCYAVQDAKSGKVILVPTNIISNNSAAPMQNRISGVSADLQSIPTSQNSAESIATPQSAMDNSPTLLSALKLVRRPVTTTPSNGDTVNHIKSPSDDVDFGIHVEVTAHKDSSAANTNNKPNSTNSDSRTPVITSPITVNVKNNAESVSTPSTGTMNKTEGGQHSVECKKEVVCDVCPQCFFVMQTPQGKIRPKKCVNCSTNLLPSNSVPERSAVTEKDFLGLYSCEVCAATFGARDKLTRHLNTVHSDSRPYSCIVCYKTFKLSYQYNRHMKVTHPQIKSWYQCDQCDYSCDQKSKLNDHVKQIHNGDADLLKSYDCQSCEEQRFIPYFQTPPEKCPKCTLKDLQWSDTLHILDVKNDTVISDNIPDANAVQHETSSHTIHPAVKSEPNSISPHELENTTLSEKKMDTDNKTVAKVSENQSEPPTTTNQTTATDVPPQQNTLPAGYLLIFPKSEPGNTAGGTPQEPLVQKVYYPQNWAGPSNNKISDGVAKDDMISTTVQMKGKPVPDGETIHQCDEPDCGAIFNQRNKLMRHQRTVHSEERPYQCEMCEKSFKRNDGLLGHVRVVHMGKKYSYRCKYCSQKFPQQSILNQHIKAIHLNELPIVENGKDINENGETTPHVNGVGAGLATSQSDAPKKPAAKPPRKRKRYKCDRCGERFYKISQLHQHKDEVHVAGESDENNEFENDSTMQNEQQNLSTSQNDDLNVGNYVDLLR